MPQSRQQILMAWQAGSDFGWGILGLNVFMHWAASDSIDPIMLFPIEERELEMMDPLRRQRLRPFFQCSNESAVNLLRAMQDHTIKTDIPVIHALGEGFNVNHKGRIAGTPNIGRAVFIDTRVETYRARLDPYDCFICASTWNADLVRSVTQKPVHVIPEGIDPALFRPGPKSGLMNPNRFYIFSGGKIEFRKAQDLTLLAFRKFSRRHDDAVLVTAWHSPWVDISNGYKGKLNIPLGTCTGGALDIPKWIADNGIDPTKTIDLGLVPNRMMPPILREMDCALQPSRAESATNLVAMEAMACGLPVIIARNTGMLDLVTPDNCVSLTRQTPIDNATANGHGGWGESDVEEIVEALEKLYASRALRQEIGGKAAAFMQQRSWAEHTETLKKLALNIG